MKNRRLRTHLLILLLVLVVPSAFSFDSNEIWQMEHLYSQKLSAGEVTDLHPSAGEWEAGVLIVGIQFLTPTMAFVHCETPGGAQAIDYRAFYTTEETSQKTRITFTLENEEEIDLYLFTSDSGDTVFSYCDAGPQPSVAIGLFGSYNKIVFRNHFGIVHRLE